MNSDSNGLWYGGIFILIITCLAYSFISWLVTPVQTRKFCAFIRVYNYQTKQWDDQYGQALIKGDKQLVGFLAVDGILHGSEDFKNTYNVYMVDPGDDKALTKVQLKDGELCKIGLIQFGNCTNEVVKHWQDN